MQQDDSYYGCFYLEEQIFHLLHDILSLVSQQPHCLCPYVFTKFGYCGVLVLTFGVRVGGSVWFGFCCSFVLIPAQTLLL